MKRVSMMVAIMLVFCMVCPVCAVSAGGEGLSAVVRIRSVFPASAGTAAIYGTERVGNGVVIDDEGTILTLSFLTRDADTIEVMVPDKEPVAATLIGFDYNTGFGLLRTKRPLGITPITLGRSSALAVGDRTIVAGSSGARELQLAQVVSRQEFAGSWEYLLEDAIFTAPSFADFSGASLINGKGQLVGIGYLYTPLSLPGFGLVPCNMFIPIDALIPILADLKGAGSPLKARRPWLGVHAAEAHGRVFITRVTAGGPAEKAGLKADDLIVSVDGKPVLGLADFYRKIWGVGDAGVTVPLAVLKGDQIRKMDILSADRHKEWMVKSEKEIKL